MTGRDDMTISRFGRGTCPACGREMSLTKAGKVRDHGDKNRHGWPPRSCTGAGQLPKEAS